LAKVAMRRKPTTARRRATNLSIREDVLAAAKRYGINASQVAEIALKRAVAEREHAAWLEENAGAIDEYNERVDREGLLNEGLRRF
jgi:post-segregation antitoxin (ccd killing protein)